MGIKIFISHASGDLSFVDRLAEDLAKDQFEVWVDRREARLGQCLIELIAQEVHGSDRIIVLLSKEAIKSQWVRKEVSLAITREVREGKQRVLPIMLSPCEIPHSLADILYFRLGEDGDYDNLLEKLKASLRTEPATISWTIAIRRQVVYRLWLWRAFNTTSFVATLVGLGLVISSLTYVAINSMNRNTTSPSLNESISYTATEPLSPKESTFGPRLITLARMAQVRNLHSNLNEKYGSGQWSAKDCPAIEQLLEIAQDLKTTHNSKDTVGLQLAINDANYLKIKIPCE